MRAGIVVPVVLGFLMFEGVALARNPGHAMANTADRRADRARMDGRGDRQAHAERSPATRSDRMEHAAGQRESLSAWKGAKYSEMPGAPGSPRNHRNASGAHDGAATRAAKATLYNDAAKRAELGQAAGDAVTETEAQPNDAETPSIEETNEASA